jgi:hypothetical protein
LTWRIKTKLKSNKSLPPRHCENCQKRPICNKLCAPVKKHVNQDWVRPGRLSYLSGSDLAQVAKNVLYSWQDLIASDKPPPSFGFLTSLQNQIIKLRCESKTCGEIARALSGGRNGNSLRTNDVRAALKTIKRKIKKNDPLVKSILKERRKTPTPAYPTIRLAPLKKLPRIIENGISKIDRRHGTNYRWRYRCKIDGSGYDFQNMTKRRYNSKLVTKWIKSIRENVYSGLEDSEYRHLKKYHLGLYYSNLDLLSELSQDFWKRPTARLFDSYRPEEKRYKITAARDYEYVKQDHNLKT